MFGTGSGRLEAGQAWVELRNLYCFSKIESELDDKDKCGTRPHKHTLVSIFYPQFDSGTCYHFRFRHRSNLWLSLVTFENGSISYRRRVQAACIYLW